MASQSWTNPPIRGRKELLPQLVGIGALLGILLIPGGTALTALALPLGLLAGCGALVLAAILLWRRRAAQAAADPMDGDTAVLEPLAGLWPASSALRASGMIVRPSEPAPLAPRRLTMEGPARPTEWGMDVLEMIEWRRFEALMEMVFAQAGFLIRAQSHGADGGVDLWLYLPRAPQTAVGVAHCRPWQQRPVGIETIRSLISAMRAGQVSRGQCVSTSGFTAEALAFADSQGVRLLDGGGLLGLIRSRSPAQQADLLDTALEGDFWRPTCVTCGDKMMARTSQAGTGFWGCVNHPRCRATQPIRQPLGRARAA